MVLMRVSALPSWAERGGREAVFCNRASARFTVSKRIGWHTFRHTYSTLLVGDGENVKVVQELMRHASTRFTLEIYSQAQLIAKSRPAALSRSHPGLKGVPIPRP